MNILTIYELQYVVIRFIYFFTVYNTFVCKTVCHVRILFTGFNICSKYEIELSFLLIFCLLIYTSILAMEARFIFFYCKHSVHLSVRPTNIFFILFSGKAE